MVYYLWEMGMSQENEDIKAAIAEIRKEQDVCWDTLSVLDAKIGALRDRCQHVSGPEGWCTICGRWV